MAKIGEIIGAGGVLPALASGAMGKENRGFAFGLLPGLMYRDQYKDKQEEKDAAANPAGMKKGGKVKKMKSGGYVRSADGCAQRGKTKGKFV